MAFFNNKRKDFSIQPPRQQVDSTPFFVTDSANIDFTLENLNLTANLTPTGVTSGIYGSATLIPILEVDQWGRITRVTTTTFSASGITLETNGNPNPVQTLLNLVAGTNMTITDDGLGNITFSSSGTGGPTTWGSITGTLTSQTDLITYLTTNYQPLLGFTPENIANKAINFTVLNNTLYPTTLAVANYISSFGYITSAITTLNGLTAATQNFATPGTSGTAPNWNSVSPNHTLNIPLASAASVIAGLISRAEYDTFNGKQDALTTTKSVKSLCNNGELDGDNPERKSVV
jgi:hypothetical protein